MRLGGKSAIIISIIFLLAFQTDLLSAPSNMSVPEVYQASFITMDEGLPSNFVDDIIMDSSGFLWIGTSGGGLCRYDGYSMSLFSTNTAVSIKNNFIRTLAEDSWKRLWIASEGGLDVLDLNTCSTCDLSGTLLEPYLDNYCSFLTVDSSGCYTARN